MIINGSVAVSERSQNSSRHRNARDTRVLVLPAIPQPLLFYLTLRQRDNVIISGGGRDDERASFLTRHSTCDLKGRGSPGEKLAGSPAKCFPGLRLLDSLRSLRLICGGGFSYPSIQDSSRIIERVKYF